MVWAQGEPILRGLKCGGGLALAATNLRPRKSVAKASRLPFSAESAATVPA
jgi:hypothetical protein